MAKILGLDPHSGNQSERTIQAIHKTSQMIPADEKTVKQFKGRKYPPWMVSSQIVKGYGTDETPETGTTRVKTNKLN